MLQPIKLLGIAGSSRRDSVNQKLLQAAAGLLDSSRAQLTILSPDQLDLPLYDGDDEAANGLPPRVLALKELAATHHGFIFACPEYNGSITPLLKNLIDWLSRPMAGEAPLASYRHKTALLLSASPGALGGLRGLVHVRAILSGIGVMVLPDQLAIGKAMEAITANGLSDGAQQKQLQTMLERLVDVTARLHG